MNTETESSIAASKICRTCLAGEEPFNEIFNIQDLSETEEKVPLSDMLLSIAYIEMQPGDGLPKEMCQGCVEKLSIAYNFKILCERSDAVLREASLPEYNKIDAMELKVSTPNSLAYTENSSEIQKEIKTYLSNCSKPLQGGLLPSAPMLLVGPEGVRVIPKAEVDIINQSSSQYSEKVSDVIIQNKFKVKKEIVVLSEEEGSDVSYDDPMYSSEPSIFTCIVCSQSFSERAELRAHKKTHPRDMRHLCPHCGKSFSRIYTLQLHVVTHSEYRAHLCPQCGKRFHHAGGLRQHLKYHQGVKPHRCQLCDKTYHSLHVLREHVRCAHSDNRYNNTCNVCGKKFTAKSTLVTHMKIHTGEKAFQCSVCGKRFTRGAYLKAHQRLHTREPPERVFRCQYEGCIREFATKATLHIHVRHKHTFERPYSCNLCLKSFISPAGLNEHRRTHSGEKPELCLLCEKRFVNKQSLKKHMRLHTGERPYPCSHCGESFLSASRRTEHVQSKHMERTHLCPLCSKKFHLRRTLMAHMRVHNGSKRKKSLPEVQELSNESQLLLDPKQSVPEAGFEIVV